MRRGWFRVTERVRNRADEQGNGAAQKQGMARRRNKKSPD